MIAGLVDCCGLERTAGRLLLLVQQEMRCRSDEQDFPASWTDLSSLVIDGRPIAMTSAVAASALCSASQLARMGILIRKPGRSNLRSKIGNALSR